MTIIHFLPQISYVCFSYTVDLFNRTSYYEHRDVERIPKALRVIYQQLEAKDGGILTLDSDLPDSFMNIVFLLDYLVRASDFTLVHVDECVRLTKEYSTQV